MEQQGEYLIPASQHAVWAALNDPDVLARCIPGCQTMAREDDTHFNGRVKAKVGPVSAMFDVGLELLDIQAPDSYRINGNVKGGPAGFGKGGATVRLESVGSTQTRLTYDVDASIGGKLAQVGSRLIDAATRKMADEFFSAFSEQLGAPGSIEAVSTDPAQARLTGTGRYETSGQWPIWIIVIIAFVLAMVLAF